MKSIPTIEQIEAKVQNLPLIDSDVAEVIALLESPESNYDLIARKLSPGLAARLLAGANTGPSGREVRSIGLAVKLLGYRKMRELLKTAIAVDHFAQRLPGFDFEKFLSQAHFCAAVAKVLGEIMNFSDPGDLMTVATLQNIGKLVIAVYFEEHHQAIVALKRKEGLPTSLAEHRIIGMNHGQIGALALQRYHVPLEICEAVKYHDPHVPIDSGHHLSELQVISREATSLAGRFRLPTAFDPVELPDHMYRTISHGKRVHSQLSQPHIRSGGYERAFPKLVSQISILVEKDMRRVLPLRQ